MMMFKEVEGLWHEQFGGTLPTEGFSRSDVELPGHGIGFGLSEAGEIHPLGEILTQQAMGVFVDAALPGAVRVGEVDRNASEFGQPFVVRHLLNPFLDDTAACSPDAYTLNKKFMTSPSFTTYSLPSARILPASLAPASPL